MILGAAAGVVAVTTAALLVRRRYANKCSNEKEMLTLIQTPDESEKLTMKALLDREGLLPVKKTANNYCLHPEYLIELLNFIGFMANAEDQKKVEEMRKTRREFFKKQQWEYYQA